jgi:hypothetical protein
MYMVAICMFHDAWLTNGVRTYALVSGRTALVDMSFF